MKKDKLFVLAGTAAMALALITVLAGCGGKNKLEGTVWETSTTLKDGTPAVYVDVYYDPDRIYEYRTVNGKVDLIVDVATYAMTGDTVSVTWGNGETRVSKLTGGALVIEGSGRTFRQLKGQAAQDSRKFVRDMVAAAAAETEKKTETAQPAKAGTPKLAAESDFRVVLTEDGQGAVIKEYLGKGGPFIIPATIQGMPVREIDIGFIRVQMYGVAKTRYKYREPNGKAGTTLSKNFIASMGWNYQGEEPNPFYDPEYRAITSIVIPDSVTKIDSGAFQNCFTLTSVTIPGSVTEIGGSAFADCSSLTSITIPDSVTEIGSGAFSGCSSLTSFTLPNSITKIVREMFRGCFSLTSVTIPDRITEIGMLAFNGCSSLTTVTISPVAGRTLWDDAFTSCHKIDLKSQTALRAAGYTGRF